MKNMIRYASHRGGKTVEQYKFLEGTRRGVLREMEKWAALGWKLASLGVAKGLQWYAIMTRNVSGNA